MEAREASSYSERNRDRSMRREKWDDLELESEGHGSWPSWSSGKRRERSGRQSTSLYSDNSECSSGDDGNRSARVITEEEIEAYKARRAQKKVMRVAKKLKSQSITGYSNALNPFGDSNLSEKFVWKKKIERDVALGADLDMFSVKAEKKRQKERMEEIEKVKKRREERGLQKAQHEEEMAMLAREHARSEFQDWEKKEEEFHFNQSKVRSDIRLREGRAKAIDILSKHLNVSDDLDIELNDPHMAFKGLTLKDLEELRGDIKMYLDLDTDTLTHVEYWKALLVVCDWELAEARKKDALDRARVRGEEPPPMLLAEKRGVHSKADVWDNLYKKTYQELEELHAGVETRLCSGAAKVVEFWEVILKRIHIYRAKAFLKEFHEKMLRKDLQRLEQPVDVVDKSETANVLSPIQEGVPDDEGSMSREPLPKEEVMESEQEAGSFSPQLLHGDETEGAVDPEEDRAALERKRMEVLEERQRQTQEAMASKPASSEDDFQMNAVKAMGAMEEGDAVFGTGAEVNLDSQVCWWHNKYQPRKLKYFNRVHTGYKWNKYNQTHYDHENPPPKVIQGYKFNVFYPDLVDKTKAPMYEIEKDGNSTETCIVRFHAGPPYEDIAFRIVLRDWEHSHKKGFKCTFQRGILHVYFNFKRYRYRR